MSPKHDSELGALRSELADVDRKILELAARRLALVTQVGRFKLRAGSSIRDFGQEKLVIDRARRRIKLLDGRIDHDGTVAS